VTSANPLSGAHLSPAARITLALVLLAGAAWILLATSLNGIGFTADSASYVAAARSLVRGAGWLDYGGGSYLTHPPGLPVFLAVPALVGVDPAVGARWLNALCFGAVLLLTAYWLLTRLRSRALAAVGIAAVFFSQPLLLVSSIAWSEIPFILLTLAALLVAEGYRAGGGTGSVAAFGVLAGLAFATRYAGAPLLLLGGILVLARPGPWLPRVRDAALFSVLALAPVVLWLARNWSLEHTLFGSRHPAPGGLSGALATTGQVAGAWFVPFSGAPGLHPLAWAGGIAAMALVVAGLWGARRAGERAGWGAALPMAAFALLYLAFMVGIKARVGTMEGRYLYPAIVPLVLVLLFAADRAVAGAVAVRLPPRAFAGAVAAALALWLGAYPVPLAVSFASDMVHYGVPEYGTVFWQRRDVVAELRKPVPEGLYLSNAPDLVYWMTGRPARFLPDAADLGRPEGADRLRRRVGDAFTRGDRVFVIWFRMTKRDNRANPADLARVVPVRRLWNAPDGSGAFYRIDPPAAQPPAP